MSSSDPRPAAWFDDPVERARFLDGECSPKEAAARRAELGHDGPAAARIRREEAFLAAVRSGAQARAAVPESLEERVRRALAADRAAGFPAPAPIPISRARRLRPALVAAAAAVAGFVVLTSVLGPSDTTAGDERVLLAAKTLRMALNGSVPSPDDGATCGQGVASPYRFPPVARREFELQGCQAMEGTEQSVSVLRKEGEGMPALGLVSVAWPSGSTAPEVGITNLEDAVVFDVAIGGARYYLATPREWVEKVGSCAACHGSSREGKPNPHSFRERGR